MKRRKRIYRFWNNNEIEIGWMGKRPPGEKRKPRRKRTKEEIRKQNQRNRINKLRRKIKANFRENDYWITLTYKVENRKTIEGVQDDMSKFLKKLRRWYRKQEVSLKFIYRIEIGVRGAVHVHLLVNRVAEVELRIKELWKQGKAIFNLTYEEGGFAKLAEYITKEPEVEGVKKRYSASRNLIIPEPEVKEYRRLNIEEPKPTPGYYIDRDSIVRGVNPFTGRSFLHYIEYKLKPEKGKGG